MGAWPLASDTARYYLALVVTAVMVPAAVNLTRSRVGRAFLAIRESEIAAQASGVPVALYKTLAFGVSAFYTGVAGGSSPSSWAFSPRTASTSSSPSTSW